MSTFASVVLELIHLTWSGKGLESECINAEKQTVILKRTVLNMKLQQMETAEIQEFETRLQLQTTEMDQWHGAMKINMQRTAKFWKREKTAGNTRCKLVELQISSIGQIVY